MIERKLRNHWYPYIGYATFNEAQIEFLKGKIKINIFKKNFCNEMTQMKNWIMIVFSLIHVRDHFLHDSVTVLLHARKFRRLLFERAAACPGKEMEKGREERE